MRSWSNLGWPDTPFGADKRPWPRTVHLIAATAVCWADDGHRAVPAAVGLVYLPVRRHGARHVETATLHIGYRLAVMETDTDAPLLADLIDGHLVQARRHAAAVAAASWPDDAAALVKLAPGPTPGITTVTDAWTDRTQRERGTALMVEVCPDSDTAATMALPRAAADNRLTLVTGAGGLLSQAETQDLYDRLADDGAEPPATTAGGADRETTVQALAVSAFTQALVVALLAGQQADRLVWTAPVEVAEIVTSVAWDQFPLMLGEPTNTRPPAR